MDASIDWQTGCHQLKLRGAHLLKTGQWADCHFLVGSEPNQTLMPGHKLILAMASPVFDAMFNGGLPEKNDPIPILDVQPDAFRGLLEYIYTDAISIASMDKACELCYVAKKYMLPYVVERCTQFLWSDLSAKNVCRAYEFAILFEEPSLAERCLQIICTQTEEMLADASFEDIQLTTLLTVLDQEYLHISTELELFLALVRYAEKHDCAQVKDVDEHTGGEHHLTPPDVHQQQQPLLHHHQQQQQPPPPSPHQLQAAPEMMHVSIDEPLQIDDQHHDDGNDNDDDDDGHHVVGALAGTGAAVIVVPPALGPPLIHQQPASPSQQQQQQQQPQPPLAMPPMLHQAAPTFRDAVKKIRFLTLTPKQFAENVARSNILTQPEAFAILMNISSPTHDIYPMPAGFSTSTKLRDAYAEPQCAVAPVLPVERAGSAGPSGSSGGGGPSNEARPKRLQPFLGFREEDVQHHVLLAERASMLGEGLQREISLRLERHRDSMFVQRDGGAGGSGVVSAAIGGGAGGGGGGGGSNNNNTTMMETRKFYCVRTIRQQVDYFNSTVTDCSLTFTVDRSICITGIQVPTQVLGEQNMHTDIPERYSELLYAHLLDSQGSRLTYTHCTSRVRYDSLLEISFDRPVFIQRNKVYKVGVAFNKLGWYPMCSCVQLIRCETVCFTFNVGPKNESLRDGLIRAIVFSQTREPFN